MAFSRTTTRHALLLGIAVLWGGLLSGCAPAAGKKPALTDPATLVREAGAEVERGCYRCLKSAAEKYEAAISAGARNLDLEAAGAWILVEARERELGLKPSGALARARAHAAGPQRATVEAYVRIASGLPRLNEGVSIEAAREASMAGRELALLLAASPVPPTIALLRQRSRSGTDPVAAYLNRSITCFQLDHRGVGDVPAVAPPIASSTPTGLKAFQSATCRDAPDPQAEQTLSRLLQAESRFDEAHFFLGRRHLNEKKLVSAEREFLTAADGLPTMAAAWVMLGSTRLGLEEYEWAAADLTKALRIEPDQRGALLLQAQALNYAGRYEEALVPAQRLIDLGEWYVSDANYWLAFSELQLGRLKEADIHVREAKRTNPMNGDTARLTGLVAHRLADFDRALTEFKLAVSRNPADCESPLHLGQVHQQKDRFEASVVAFVTARDCYARAVESATARRKDVEASALSGSRKDAAKARLNQRIAGYRTTQAGASLGAAEGETQRGAWDKALAYLAEAETDSSLSARVGELRMRITALRARR